MSNKPRRDPYWRKPPKIDLASGEFQRTQPEAEPTVAVGDPGMAGGPAMAGETAIEPMAATGLDATPPDTSAAPASEPAASIDPALEPASSPAADPAEVIYDSRAANEPPTVEPETVVSSRDHEPANPSALSGLGRPDDTVAPPAPDAIEAEPARPARRGFGPLLAASLIGGVVGAGIAIGAETWLDQTSGALDGRVAALEQRPGAPPAADTGALERRIAALETGTRGLAESVAAARAAAESASRQPAATPAPSVDEIARRGLEQVTARLGTLDTGVKSVTDRVGGAATAQAVTEIGTRVTALQETVRATQEGLRATQENARQAGVNAGAITDMRTRLDALQAQSQDQVKAGSAALQALQAKSQDQETRLATLNAEAAKLPPALMQAGLRAIVAGQIAESLRGGTAIGAPLGALEKLGLPAPSLDALKPYASAPPPSAPMLAAEFRPIAERITAEPRVAADTFGDRLLRIAEKVVTVRAVGDGSGTDQPALVARIESALNRGALADAAATWDALPETARGVSSEWAARLKARVAADAALRQISADSLAALSATTR